MFLHVEFVEHRRRSERATRGVRAICVNDFETPSSEKDVVYSYHVAGGGIASPCADLDDDRR